MGSNFRFKNKLYSGIKKETYEKILQEHNELNNVKEKQSQNTFSEIGALTEKNSNNNYYNEHPNLNDELHENDNFNNNANDINNNSEQLELELLDSNKFVACKEHLTGETVLFSKRDILGLKNVEAFSQVANVQEGDLLSENILTEPDTELINVTDSQLSQALRWNNSGYTLQPNQTHNARRQASFQARQTYFDMLTMSEIYNQLIRIAPTVQTANTLETLNNEMRVMSFTMLNIYRQLSANIVTPRPPRFVPIGNNFCGGLNTAINQLNIILFDLIRLTRLVNIQNINRQLLIMITITQNQISTLNNMQRQHCSRLT